MTEGGSGGKACLDFDETSHQTLVEDEVPIQNVLFHSSAETGIQVENEK